MEILFSIRSAGVAELMLVFNPNPSRGPVSLSLGELVLFQRTGRVNPDLAEAIGRAFPGELCHGDRASSSGGLHLKECRGSLRGGSGDSRLQDVACALNGAHPDVYPGNLMDVVKYSHKIGFDSRVMAYVRKGGSDGGIKTDRTNKLLQEATQLLKTLRVQPANPKVKVMQVGGMDRIEENMVLIDLGLRCDTV